MAKCRPLLDIRYGTSTVGVATKLHGGVWLDWCWRRCCVDWRASSVLVSHGGWSSRDWVQSKRWRWETAKIPLYEPKQQFHRPTGISVYLMVLSVWCLLRFTASWYGYKDDDGREGEWGCKGAQSNHLMSLCILCLEIWFCITRRWGFMGQY